MNTSFRYHIGSFLTHNILESRRNSQIPESESTEMSMENEMNEEIVLKLETKDVFIDLENKLSKIYLKISEEVGSNRNAVLIPISGINKLQKVLDDVRLIANSDLKLPKQIRFSKLPTMIVFFYILNFLNKPFSTSSHISLLLIIM